jgi:acetate kinase
VSGLSEYRVLVINAGSSSLKAGLYTPGDGKGLAAEAVVVSAEASGIGAKEGKLTVNDGAGCELAANSQPLASQLEALQAVVGSLREHGYGDAPIAVGHRIVHGGPRLLQHTRLTPQVLDTLSKAVHFAPLHLPGSLALIDEATKLFPDAVQIGCFDTAFHQTMPPEASRLPIPARFAEAGIRRYGFHGLSYESIVAQLRAEASPLPERMVVAHLGSGSSLCAVRRGHSVDTTMGLTPTGGVLMGTRSGDLDPGVLLMLARAGGYSTDTLETLVNHECGLAGISGGSGDMQELEAISRGERGAGAGTAQAAALAFQIFTIAVAKQVAALVVPLHGLDLLVFTGGIGEHSSSARASVVAGLAPFGLQLDERANAQGSAGISGAGSKVTIRVMPAEEDLVIASHIRRLLKH